MADAGAVQSYSLGSKAGSDSESMDEEAIAKVLDERRYKIRYIQREDEEEAEANSKKTNSGPVGFDLRPTDYEF